MTIKLAPRPSIAEEARSESVVLAQELLADAEKGDVAELFMVVKHPDGTWSQRRTGTMSVPDMAGRLGIAKLAMELTYLKEPR